MRMSPRRARCYTKQSLSAGHKLYEARTFAENILKKVRNVIAVAVAMIVAICIYYVGEQLNWLWHPFTATVDMTDREEVKSHLSAQPLSIWVNMLIVWSAGSLLAGYLIKYICRSNNYSLPLIAGCLLTLFGTRNMFSFPHPVWFTIIAFLTFIPFVLLGFMMLKVKSKRRR